MILLKPLADVLNKKALDENEVEIIEEDEDEEDDVGDEVVVVQVKKQMFQLSILSIIKAFSG